MSHSLDVETMGPVDVAVIVFEGNQFNGDVAPAIAELSDEGVVRILDLAFVIKDLDGTTAVVELADADLAEAFERVSGEPLDLLNDEDLEDTASGLDPGTSALLVVWENTWAARLAGAIRESKGELVVLQRIPRQTVVTALTALEGE